MNYTLQLSCKINYTHAFTEQDISNLKEYALKLKPQGEIKNFWLDLTKDKAEDVITLVSSALHPAFSSFFEAKYGLSEDAECAIYYTALAFFVNSAKNDKDFPHNSASIKISDIALSKFTSNK